MFIMITIMIIMHTLIWETDINWVINKEVFVEVVQTRLVRILHPLKAFGQNSVTLEQPKY